MVTVLSLGGSIVAPDKPDSAFLQEFSMMLREWLKADAGRKVIMVVGGGAPARYYQNAYRDLRSALALNIDNTEADWIGITATYLNAQLVKACFADLCPNSVVYNPTEPKVFAGQILVAAGWKPGFSTDNDAVLLAEKFSADCVINLSNIEKVYTDDPKKNPKAKAIDKITWEKFIEMVGTEWVPGKNVPFDPIASAKARKIGLKVICAAGRNIENLKNILDGKSFIGTTIQG